MTEVLSVQGLNKSFGAVVASKDISFDLKSGEIHALIGANGAGKSTLIKQIAGGLKPDSGQVHFLGKDVTLLGTAARARMGLGRSFQVSAVVPEFTVLQNIILTLGSREGHSLRLFRRWDSDATLISEARTQAARTKLDGRLSVVAGDLAHGERRRLELAMALALQPKAFLLDEPMAGLGAKGRKRSLHCCEN